MKAALPFLLALGVVATAASAQGPGRQPAGPPQSAVADPTHAPGAWGQFKVFRINDRSVSDADFRAASATLQQVDAILRRVPALAPPPDGVLVAINPTVGSHDNWTPADSPYRRHVVAARYMLIFLHPTLFCLQGQCSIDRGEGPSIVFYINTPHMLVGPSFTVGSERWYMAPRELGNVAGFPLYDSFEGRLWLTKRKQPPWLPVTQEEWVRARLEQEQRRAPPSYAGAEIQQRYASNLAKLQQELEGLSPPERAAPAYFGSGPPLGETPLPSGRLRPGVFQARMVVRLNKDFFDPQLPPSTPQTIVIGIDATSLGWTEAADQKLRAQRSKAGVENAALWAAMRKDLDWKALFELLQ